MSRIDALVVWAMIGILLYAIPAVLVEYGYVESRVYATVIVALVLVVVPAAGGHLLLYILTRIDKPGGPAKKPSHEK